MIAAIAVVDESMGQRYCVDEYYYLLCVEETKEEAEQKANKVRFTDEEGDEIPHVIKYVEFKLGKTTRAFIGRTHYYE
jgi:hypothetical protein